MRRFIWLDFEQLFCPVCMRHILPRVLINTEMEIGDRITVVDQLFPDRRNVVIQKLWKGKITAPFSIILREKFFMGRSKFEVFGMTIGAFDEVGNYYFRRKLIELG